ncbi:MULTISPECIES: DUF4139 domain-containing protein [Methylobacterium]|uniref:DUF4139 domain-containing protein n=1 Tax=Methylobacterium radiotolerans TaxID=31998 RepID=A0ABV2NE69_9HYPH|nr:MULTISPECIES: DUF4139 domain-containing protein [unclassified Methylobacterium]MBP2491981.1 hypothetical protein [Methylobacterium sp. PvP105]MBP2501647.1 hypothetical protein [Methylobacterium sp. PvP109]MCX7331882.1 DUF4139 domain-containing protein [Hyphomicrobiales bacterium]
MTSHVVWAGVLLCMIAAAPPLRAASPGRIRAVTLSSGGLAEVTQVHPVDGDATIGLDARSEQIDDILKSLVVRDPVGTVGALRLDGLDQADETLRTMPFTADDLSGPARLLGKLQGVPIRIQSGGRTLEGRVLGVSERNAGTESGEVAILTVLTGTGTLESVSIEDGAAVTIQDSAMAAKIAEAIAAAGTAKVGDAHRVEVDVSGRGQREIRLTYVVAAPVWKTSYRIVDGGGGRANLQAWAIIENALGADWAGVDVTLSSGSPVALLQRLHRRYWRKRPEAPVMVEDVGMPDLDPGTVAPRSVARLRAPAPAAAPLPAPMARMDTRAESAEPSYDAAAATAGAAASEGDVAANFTLPHPVDLRAGSTLSVPFIDTEIEAERVALWQPGRGIHPTAAFRIRNSATATLPAGLITLYDREAGYLGDARLPATPVGEQRLASFALDRKVAVQAETEPSQALTQITVVDGVARATVIAREVTTYTIKGAPDAARSVIIEHPRREGWTLTASARDSETPTAYRLKVAVPAGGTAETRAVLEHVQIDAYDLVDADEALLVRWAALATDPELGGKLKTLSRARAEVAAATRTVEEIAEREAKVQAEQERIRSNLGAVPKDSELARRYLTRMGGQEDELAKLAAARAEAESGLKASQARIRTLIAAL